MSKRLDKKKLKRQTTAIESPIAETSASKETINFFIQYQDQEYLFDFYLRKYYNSI